MTKAEKESQKGLSNNIHEFKASLNETLDDLAKKLLSEQQKLETLQEANQLAELNLKEQHEIIKQANTLDALLLANKKKQLEIDKSIQQRRDQWQKEQQTYTTEQDEQKALLTKQRKREQDEYDYQLKITRQKEEDAYQTKKQQQERELSDKRESFEKEIAEREHAVVENEEKLVELETKVASFPKELQSSIDQAIKDTTDKLSTKFEYESSLAQKQHEGALALYKQTNQSLESIVAEQKATIAELNKKVNSAGSQVQEIALHAIESSAKSKQPITINPSEKNNADNR